MKDLIQNTLYKDSQSKPVVRSYASCWFSSWLNIMVLETTLRAIFLGQIVQVQCGTLCLCIWLCLLYWWVCRKTGSLPAPKPNTNQYPKYIYENAFEAVHSIYDNFYKYWSPLVVHPTIDWSIQKDSICFLFGVICSLIIVFLSLFVSWLEDWFCL